MRTAIDAFWKLPSLQLLRNLNLSDCNLDAPVLKLIEACAPNLYSLRLRRANGVAKIWSTKGLAFPKLLVLDLWSVVTSEKEPVTSSRVLEFVRTSCGNRLQEFRYRYHNTSFHAVDPLRNALAPHSKTLRILMVSFSSSRSFLRDSISQSSGLRFTNWFATVRGLKSFLETFSALEQMCFPLRETFWSMFRSDSSRNTVQDEFLSWRDSVFPEGRAQTLRLVEVDGYSRCNPERSVFDSLCQPLSRAPWFGGDASWKFLTEDCPSWGFVPTETAFLYAYDYDFQYGQYHGNIRSAPGDRVTKYLLERGLDPTRPCIGEWGASAVHMHAICDLIIKVVPSLAAVPSWFERNPDLRNCRDLYGRSPAMYKMLQYGASSTFLPLSGLDIVDLEGNTLLHYAMANYIFDKTNWNTSTAALALVGLFDELLKRKWTLFSRVNDHGISVHSLLAGTPMSPVRLLLKLDPLSERRSSYWSNISVEEPVLTRLVSNRQSVDMIPAHADANGNRALVRNPLLSFICSVFKTATEEDLNAKRYGPKRNLPFLHAAVEAEAVWVFTALLELPEVCERIDLNALDYMGRTPLHVAVAPRKDSVFPTPQLLKMMMDIGMSATLPDKGTN